MKEDLEAAIDFIKMKYQILVKNNPERLRIHVVNSMDEDSVMIAFKDVQNFFNK
jgi:hypothetical protein